MIPTAHLDAYARLLVHHAVGLRPGQDLHVRGSADHYEFALQIGESAYEIARSVHYHFVHPEALAQLIRCGSPAQLALHSARESAYYAEILQKGAALISLATHHEPPEPLAQAAAANPRNHALFIQGRQEAFGPFVKPSARRLFASTNAPVATPRWAKKIFPELSPEEAIEKLWKLLLQASYADQPDALKINSTRAAQRQAREKYLNQLGIREIRITGGGNNLKIVLSPQAKWTQSCNQTTAGQIFYTNFPSEEIFTVPDGRQTEGRLVASQPLRLYNGALVKHLALEFRQGKVVRTEAEEGRETIEKWLEIDDGARQLGEIGLIGQDSAIAATDTYFDLINLDENAAAHVALGQALAHNLEGGETLTTAELTALGWNRSTLHADVLFGSSEITVTATGRDGGETVLIEQGRWRD